ncbi:hypothetical protein JAAARDRAFT_39592 [Jaapia argillacea MUCL 33604]|uniref:Uncharacterized protein n=1 Tax=Jaapia argillacea MUCL 33604 TaxID=933084 RepID=A0A067PPJ6_9AGAM|nr:hypothetical protein JAAARDRAFT_39592 [Jaapia argillacea MUCL 33604]
MQSLFWSAASSQISSEQYLRIASGSLPSLYRKCATLAILHLSNVAVASDDRVRYFTPMWKWMHDLGEATNNIHNLLLSQRLRVFLHEVLTGLKVDEGTIRDALRDDEAQILSRLQSVLQSESCKKEVLLLENENAERFLVFLQDVIDNFPIDDDLRRSVQRLSINLSQASEKLPPSLLLRGVVTSNDRHIGGGGFADIFRGEYAHQDVALKRLRIFQSPQEKVRIKRMFFREALIWHRLKHPRVLPFLGIDAESFAPHICIVSSWIRNSDIMTYLGRNGLGSLDAHRVLTEVAEGLQYLHKQYVVHGDLRGGNIFLDDSCHVLLADFGLTNFADATKVVTTVRHDGSMRWMSPELHFPNKFGMSFRRTFASDVYAFGCVCLEVLTGERPFSDVPSDLEFLVAVLISQLPTRPDLGEPVRQTVLDKIWPIILRCLAQAPRDRPSTLSESGSLLELVMTASVVTAVLEVKNPTVTGGTDGSPSVSTTPSQQITVGRSRLGFPPDPAPVNIQTLPHRHSRIFDSVPTMNRTWSSGTIEAAIGETLTPGLSDRDKGRVEEKRLYCDIRGSSFSGQKDLLDHRATHAKSEGKLFPCRKCDKIFLRKSDRSRHVHNVHRDSTSTSAIGHQPPSQI